MDDRLEAVIGPPPAAARSVAGRLVAALLMAGSGLLVLVVWARPFLADPTRLPPSQDIAWYTWRSLLLTAQAPAVLVGYHGPLDAFSGGYRVASPLLGALLTRLGAVDRYSISVLLMAGLPVLTALALGGLAYRYRRDPLLFAGVTLFAGGIFFINPYVGFLDNMLALFFITCGMGFLPEARDGARGRVALFVLLTLAFFAHPPTTLLAIATIGAAVAARAVLTRSLKETVRAEGPIAAVAVGATAAAFLAWRVGMWGPARSFGESAHPPPYTREVFLDHLKVWIGLLRPFRTFPLAILGLAVLVLAWRRFRDEPLPRTIVIWLLPIVGIFGFVLGRVYPYNRFFNSTLAPVLLAGIGLWAVVRLLLRLGVRGRAWLAAGAIAATAFAAFALVPIYRTGTSTWEGRTPWMTPDQRVWFAAVRAYAAADPGHHPVVFVHSDAPRIRAWGLWKGDANRARLGVPPSEALDSYMFYGAVEDFLAGRPSIQGNEVFDEISRATFEDVRAGVGDREPLLVLIHFFNTAEGNLAYTTPERSVLLDKGVFLVRGPGLASPDGAALRAGAAEAERTRAALADPAGKLANLGHTLRVVVALAFLLVVPGALAARWFGRLDLGSALGTIPGLSVAMNLLAGIAVLAVLRRPVTFGVAVLITAVATAAGGALLLVSFRRPPGSPPAQPPAPEAEPAAAALPG